MKSKLRRPMTSRANVCAIALSTCTLLAAPANADTTYYYSGTLSGSAVFGNTLTGLVTFDFDTTGVSGTYIVEPHGHISQVQFSAQNFTAGTPNLLHFSIPYLTLTDGEITSWYISTLGFPVGCAMPSGPNLCNFSSGSGNPPLSFPNGDIIQQSCATCFAETARGSGTWSVPFPAIGAGLPGLLFAALGMIGWRRRRQKIATTSTRG
jgi:hypothetical protein